jgi:peroxisomal enoyl-CoA hydratase 2
VCTRIVTGIFRRGVAALGDIEPFTGRGISPSLKLPTPEREPDLQVQARIADNQAQLYRLSGDYNPLHIDPAAARFGGFEAPILHGLCTFGHCAQLLTGALCGGDPARFGGLRLRFASPVFPGDTLHLLAWHDGPGRVRVEGRVGERGYDAFSVRC